MPDQHDLPGGSDDPTRAHDPIDPTRAQDPVDPTRAQDPVEPTRVQPGVDPTRAQDATWARPAATSRRRAAGRRAAPPPTRRRPRPQGCLVAVGAARGRLIAIVLFALLNQGDDDDDAVGTDDQTETVDSTADTAPEDTAPADTTADTAPEDTATDDGAATDDTTATTAPAGDDDAASGAEGDPGTMTTVDGTDLFTLVQGDAGDAERLAPYADQDVTGEGVYVLEVVEGEGFWIGADEQQRIFAHASADASAEAAGGPADQLRRLREGEPG